MAKYRGPKCKLQRREGTNLLLKTRRIFGAKGAEGRPYPPGQHGQLQRKTSDYQRQLREKQKLKRFYGLMEKPFRNLFQEAERGRTITGEALLQLLERRLDNVVFRLGFGVTRAHARQIVNHGHILVNGKKVNIPSYRVKPGDLISVAERSKKLGDFPIISQAKIGYATPDWLQVDLTKLEGRVLAIPSRDQIDTDVQEQLVVELYSRV
jgi:small subunit ribosomal protein S4